MLSLRYLLDIYVETSSKSCWIYISSISKKILAYKWHLKPQPLAEIVKKLKDEVLEHFNIYSYLFNI